MSDMPIPTSRAIALMKPLPEGWRDVFPLTRFPETCPMCDLPLDAVWIAHDLKSKLTTGAALCWGNFSGAHCMHYVFGHGAGECVVGFSCQKVAGLGVDAVCAEIRKMREAVAVEGADGADALHHRTT